MTPLCWFGMVGALAVGFLGGAWLSSAVVRPAKEMPEEWMRPRLYNPDE